MGGAVRWLAVLLVVVACGTSSTATVSPTSALVRGPIVSAGTMAFDESAGEMVLIDPSGGGTWTWDGKHAWQLRQTSARPATTNGKVGGPPFGVGWDSTTDSLVAVIGDLPAPVGATQLPPSTWIWRSHGWTRLARAGTPDVVGGGIAAYPPKQQLIMFSGCCTPGGRFLTAKPGMWSWDGHAWSELHPAHMPPARWGAVMVYDPTVGRTLMYGGMSIEPDHAPLTDMWAWDGTDWSPLPAPALGEDQASPVEIAYAPDGALVLTTIDATWAWHGSDWVKLDAATPACFWCELAYDPVHKLTVMVTNTAGHPLAVNEVWVWDGARWSQRS
jgi:hypothetical protein